jgi:hypothetical protein
MVVRPVVGLLLCVGQDPFESVELTMHAVGDGAVIQGGFVAGVEFLQSSSVSKMLLMDGPHLGAAYRMLRPATVSDCAGVMG